MKTAKQSAAFESATRLTKVRRLVESGGARMIREAAGLSLREMAAAIDAHVTTIWKWERGERRPHGALALRYLDLLETLAGQ